jgi:hypothetical protein
MGRLASSNGAAPVASAAPRTPTDREAATPAMPQPVARRVPRDQVAVIDQSTGMPISHIFGVGGRVGSPRNVGATTRVWRNDRVGLQFSVTRDARTSGVAAGRVTSMELEPGAVYALFDHVSEYVWIRPYIGSGLSFHRQSLQESSRDLVQGRDNGFGFRVFAGSELTFASVQRFGLSVEFGYRRVPTPFPGFAPDKLSASLAGHWYIK